MMYDNYTVRRQGAIWHLLGAKILSVNDIPKGANWRLHGQSAW